MRLLAFIGLLALCLPAAFSQEKKETVQEGIIRLTNEFRKTQGKDVLKPNDKLTVAAQKHAENMAKKELYSHIIDGKSPADRAQAASYGRAVGENIVWDAAGGAEAAQRVVTAFKNSPGHRKNMLGNYQEIAIGVAKSASGKWYYCQLLGTPEGNNGVGFVCHFDNKTPYELGVFFKLANATFKVRPEKITKINTETSIQEFAVQINLPKDVGKPIATTVRNGKTYVISGDPKKGFRVEEK